MTGSSSYLEKLSVILMNGGHLAPQFGKIALLYTDSHELQPSTCEFYIVVVDLCHEILKFLREFVFGKFGSSLSDFQPSEISIRLKYPGKYYQRRYPHSHGQMDRRGIESKVSIQSSICQVLQVRLETGSMAKMTKDEHLYISHFFVGGYRRT